MRFTELSIIMTGHYTKGWSYCWVGRPKAALLFWLLVVSDVVCSYVLLFLSDIKIENR